MRRVSTKGVEFIASFEGCRLEPYQDITGVWTVGFGHTGPGTRAIHLKNEAEARELLRKDLESFEESVRRVVTAPLSQQQFDALVSFAYNLGSGALTSSTLLRQLNGSHYAKAANEFPKWDKAGGLEVEGLKRRRLAERDLFLKGSNRGTRVVARATYR